MAEESVLDEIEKCINEEKIENVPLHTKYEKETSIGRKMAYCREILGFTRKEMADVFETSPSKLANYERDVTLPPLKLLFLYAQYFEIPMEDFVDDFISLKEFTVKYCIFHFIKFKTIYKFIHKK